MKNISTRLTSVIATGAALSVAIAFSANNPAQAITFNYSYQSNTGYSASGQFSYDQTTAPATISESGLGPTNFLQSISLSVFDPSGNLLDSGNSVVNGVSSDSFLLFEFNTLTETIVLLDVSTDTGNEPFYYISNTYDSSGNLVPPGSTTFNLNTFAVSTNTTTSSLGSAPSIQVQVAATPEPASVLGLLALGALGAGSLLKKKKA